MMGGMQEHAVDAGIKDLVSHNVAAINSKTHVNATSWTVNKAWTQVVAGTNYFLHLTSNDGKKASVVIYKPLGNEAAQVTFGEANHTAARNPN